MFHYSMENVSPTNKNCFNKELFQIISQKKKYKSDANIQKCDCNTKRKQVKHKKKIFNTLDWGPGVTRAAFPLAPSPTVTSSHPPSCRRRLQGRWHTGPALRDWSPQTRSGAAPVAVAIDGRQRAATMKGSGDERRRCDSAKLPSRQRIRSPAARSSAPARTWLRSRHQAGGVWLGRGNTISRGKKGVSGGENGEQRKNERG